MKTQIKKGLLDICVLASLIEDDSYGYKLLQDTQALVQVSESTLYPILRRLEKAEYLRSYSLEHQGRLRKYYQITPQGQKQIKDFLDEWQDIDKVYQFIKGRFNDEQK
ncbi:MAG: PadR family transcriptional regulator [Bacilli bacterium]